MKKNGTYSMLTKIMGDFMVNKFWIILFLLIMNSHYAFTQRIGEICGILDYPVNVRTAPNLQAKVIDQLGLNNFITILERTKIEQKIEGIDDYWYKIEYYVNESQKTGYVWGGYIARGSMVCHDIDGDGENDYFFYRDSGAKDANVDIVIYIGGKRIYVGHSELPYRIPSCRIFYSTEMHTVFYVLDKELAEDSEAYIYCYNLSKGFFPIKDLFK